MERGGRARSWNCRLQSESGSRNRSILKTRGRASFDGCFGGEKRSALERFSGLRVRFASPAAASASCPKIKLPTVLRIERELSPPWNDDGGSPRIPERQAATLPSRAE